MKEQLKNTWDTAIKEAANVQELGFKYNPKTFEEYYNSIDHSKRLKMRKDADAVFELTKGFTSEPTDEAMKTALLMAHYVLVLTSDLSGTKLTRNVST